MPFSKRFVRLVPAIGHERDAALYADGDRSAPDSMHARMGGGGRFLAVDPLYGDGFLPQSWNRYVYVFNNPVNLIDPWGLLPISCVRGADGFIRCKGSIGITDHPPGKGPSGGGSRGTPRIESMLQRAANASAGVGDGILATLSFGLVSGHELRQLTGADQVVDRCSAEYLGGRAGGTAVALGAYGFGAIPKSLIHFTTKAGAAGIASSGGVIVPSTGLTLFGNGVYATAGSRLLVPAASTTPIAISGQGFMRMLPNAAFLKGGSAQTAAIFGGYAAIANRDAVDCGED